MPTTLERRAVERYIDPVDLQSTHTDTEPAMIGAGCIDVGRNKYPAMQFDLRSIGRNHEGYALRVGK